MGLYGASRWTKRKTSSNRCAGDRGRRWHARISGPEGGGCGAGRETARRDASAVAFAPLHEGAVAPGLKVPNLVDRACGASALESALGDIDARGEAVTLVVPDAAARVLLLDFDALPSKRQEALPVVRFRLRKMVPFDVEGAAVSYQVMTTEGRAAQRAGDGDAGRSAGGVRERGARGRIRARARCCRARWPPLRRSEVTAPC